MEQSINESKSDDEPAAGGLSAKKEVVDEITDVTDETPDEKQNVTSYLTSEIPKAFQKIFSWAAYFIRPFYILFVALYDATNSNNIMKQSAFTVLCIIFALVAVAILPIFMYNSSSMEKTEVPVDPNSKSWFVPRYKYTSTQVSDETKRTVNFIKYSITAWMMFFGNLCWFFDIRE